MRHGRPENPPEAVPLAAGPLTCDYVAGDLRNIRLGEQEIIRRIYVAVRDRYWNTIPATLDDVRITANSDSFAIRYRATHRQGNICFRREATITGDASGEIVFAMDGEACSTFLRNRIGICVLHPYTCAGAPCRVTHTDGTITRGCFPQHISPQQPFVSIREIAHEVSDRTWARVTFSGDVFEMEDQRNWTDASFKTYSTPLAWPAPVRISEGTPIQQSVRLTLEGDVRQRPRHTPATDVRLAIGSPLGRTLPPVGLGAGAEPHALHAASLAALRALRLSHLRVVLDGHTDPIACLSAAARTAIALGCPLEMAVSLRHVTEPRLAQYASTLSATGCSIARWLLLCDDLARDDAAKRIQHLRPRLDEIAPGAPIGSGTDHYFTEFNRTPPPVQYADFVSYTLNPQVHAFDDLSLMETLPMQAETVTNASRLAGGLPVAISPISLRPRTNPHRAAEGEAPALAADPRQAALFGAAWTLGSLAMLAGHPSLASLTYYELAGPAGVLQLPDRDMGTGLEVYPVYHVLRWLGTLRGAPVLYVNNTAPERVAALACDTAAGPRVALANLTGQPQRVRLSGLRRAVSLLRLDEETAAAAAGQCDFVSGAYGPLAPVDADLVLTLPPYGLAFFRS